MELKTSQLGFPWMRCNDKTTVKFFIEAMGILWRQGILYDNVLLFISDVVPYKLKARQTYAVYPKIAYLIV